MHLKIWYEHMVQNQPDHWKLVLDPKVSKIKSLDFFPIFLTNRVWSNQAKYWKLKDSPVSTNIISNVCMIYHMKVHMVRYNFSRKKLQNPKFIFCLFMNKRTSKRRFDFAEISNRWNFLVQSRSAPKIKHSRHFF